MEAARKGRFYVTLTLSMSTGEVELNSGIMPVETDTLSYGFIAGIQQRFTDKIYNPAVNPQATQHLLQERHMWTELGAVTVLTSGVFDMLHPDHSGYLLHTKAQGAAELYRRNIDEKPWGKLHPTEQQEYTVEALSSNNLRLIVSVDGDKSVAARKGFKLDKGNAPRPIYAWNTRALQVASQSYINPRDPAGGLLPIVDAVTIHGPNDFDQDSIHSSHFSLAETLQPDVWAVYGESKDILDEVPLRPSLASIAVRCIMDGSDTHYHEDDGIGKISTTAIVNRIQQSS